MALDFLLFIQCLHSERTHYKLYKSKATLFLINHHAIEVHEEVKTHLKNYTWVGGQLHAQAAFFSTAQQPIVGQGLLIIEVS